MGDGSETLSVNQITCDSVSESSETNQNEDRNTNENTSEMNQNEEQTIDTTEGTQSRKEKPPDKGQQREKNLSRRTSVSFQRALRDVCFHVSKDNRLINEVSQIVGSDTDTVVLMLSRCLPHIVPNVLLAKRETHGKQSMKEQNLKKRSSSRLKEQTQKEYAEKDKEVKKRARKDKKNHLEERAEEAEKAAAREQCEILFIRRGINKQMPENISTVTYDMTKKQIMEMRTLIEDVLRDGNNVQCTIK
ncbi:unnamed protein product [Mytilus edulis]|uniref:Uncharacterized protein n=1 Tax=Mytilus edulis TaxID=6550 RepID=A0A8S3VJ94_MYTED|nr:unnamed protein product [Mytilus edulis]